MEGLVGCNGDIKQMVVDLEGRGGRVPSTQQHEMRAVAHVCNESLRSIWGRYGKYFVD